MTALSIGDLARRSGCKHQTIRWYEAIGMLPQAARTAGGHRVYGPHHLARLEFIRHARGLGFPLDDIRTLLDLSCHPDRTCDDAHDIGRRLLQDVDARMRRLAAIRDELQRIVASCTTGGPAADCRILDALADYRHDGCAAHGDTRAGG
jgi:DNA-binding transcriptional MerR regulator